MKENSNPTVHSVSRRRHTKAPLLLFFSNDAEEQENSLSQQPIKNALKDMIYLRNSNNNIEEAENSLKVLNQAGFFRRDINTSNEEEGTKNKFAESQMKSFDIMTSKTMNTTSSDSQNISNIFLYNPSPISNTSSQPQSSTKKQREEIDSEEIFDMIRDINDPEHPLTLEQLNVVCQKHIYVVDASISDAQQEERKLSTVHVRFT